MLYFALSYNCSGRKYIMNYDFRLAEKALEKEFERVNDIRDFNQRKVLKALFDN